MAKKQKPKKENKTIQIRESELKSLKKELVDKAMQYSYTVMLNVMRDYFGFGKKRLHRVWDGIQDLGDSISKGYVSFYDLEKVLKEEAGIVMSINGKGRYVDSEGNIK